MSTSNNVSRKLSKQQVIDMLNQYVAGVKISEICNNFGVNRQNLHYHLRHTGIGHLRNGANADKEILSISIDKDLAEYVKKHYRGKINEFFNTILRHIKNKTTNVSQDQLHP